MSTMNEPKAKPLEILDPIHGSFAVNPSKPKALVVAPGAAMRNSTIG